MELPYKTTLTFDQTIKADIRYYLYQYLQLEDFDNLRFAMVSWQHGINREVLMRTNVAHWHYGETRSGSLGYLNSDDEEEDFWRSDIYRADLCTEQRSSFSTFFWPGPCADPENCQWIHYGGHRNFEHTPYAERLYNRGFYAIDPARRAEKYPFAILEEKAKHR